VPLYEGNPFITPILTATATYYVSVEGDGLCENAPNDRQEVTVTVTDPTTQGTDFYVSFGKNIDRPLTDITLQIRIVARQETTVSFYFKDNPMLNTSFLVAAGSVYTYELTPDQKTAVYSELTGTSDKSLRIQSTEPISVYALNQSHGTTDATFVLPVDVLGTDYYQMSYLPSTGFGDGYTVVATEDGTKIYENSSLKTTLQSGEVYSAYYMNTDITGYHITSTNPVAYFVTNQLVNITHSVGNRDHLFEQMIPVSAWGKTFIVPVTMRGVERIRIIASQDGTTITQNGGTIKTDGGGQSSPTLNKGQFIELEATLAGGGCYISADKPVGVGSYLVGMGYSSLIYGKNAVGDPALTWVPPIEQMVLGADIAPFIPTGTTYLTEHYALILTPTATRDQTRVAVGNSPPVDLSDGSWTTCVNQDYSFYSMPLTSSAAAYRFTNPHGLLVMGFGLGSMESYYYLSGAAMRTLEAAFYVDDNHYLDIDGQTVCIGDEVTFRASGIQPAATPGYLKWYIDNVEQQSHEDALQWSAPLTPGQHTVRIDVTDLCKTYSFTTTFTVVPTAKPANITANDATVCYNKTPTLTAASTIPSAQFKWYDTQTSVPELGTGDTFSPSSPLTAGRSYYVSVSSADTCENKPGNRKEVTVTVLPQSIFNYPDFRIWACPGASGGEINLSKYLDTVASPGIVWGAAAGSPAINASGIIDADKLVAPNTYTYTYTVFNPCVDAAGITRKIYLKMLGSNGLKQSQDTVTVCSETAEAVNINQIFGIDAGGTWMYDSPDGNISSYVTTSAAYGGAVIMNGKGIYEDSSIAAYPWHGITDTKRVVFTYTPDGGSCLAGQTYKIVIILTPDMM
jgi:hypothetical protein